MRFGQTIPSWGFPGGWFSGKESTCNAGDLGLIPGSGRSPGGNGNPLQYSCLENSMDRGFWWATVHGAPKPSGTWSFLEAQGRGRTKANQDFPHRSTCKATEIKILGNLWATGSHQGLKMLWDPQGCIDFWDESVSEGVTGNTLGS